MPSQELPRRDLAFRDELAGFSLLLKRNCSISPAGLLYAFGALSAAALAIGIGFAFAGAWLILPFAGLELPVLSRFVPHCHAHDHEQLTMNGDMLRIEAGEVGRATARI